MIHYLIDTDWVIDFLKGKKETFDKLSELYESGLAISVISLSELYEGVYGSTNKEKHLTSLEAFLNGITVLDVNDKIAELFGQERARLLKSGKLIDNFDLMIASTCLYYDLTLLTNNLKHFGRIEGLKIGHF